VKIFAMVRAELARLWSTKMARLALVALMCVPIIYGGLYLWANQDPYSKLDQVPVALVVSDTGADDNGATTNFGDDVADQLIEDGSFQWHRVSAKNAAVGVKNGAYDFSVTLPSNFSQSLTSSDSDNPRQAEVLLTTNDANSYLASTIGEQAVKTIQTSIVKTVNEKAANTFLDGLAEVRVNLVDAVDGTQKLLDGANTAVDGSAQLADGTAQLATGSATLRDGLAELQSKTASLPAQSAQLASGAAQVAAGNQKIAGYGTQVAGVTQQIADEVPAARARIQQDLVDLGLDQAQIDRVLAGLDPLGQRITSGNQQVQAAAGQLNTLASGAQQVATGAQALADASPALVQGIGQAASGSSQLADGASQANDGAQSLASGLVTLRDGLQTLEDGLSSGVSQIPDNTDAQRDAQAKNIADPVTLKNTAVTSAGTYGAGLAPFFVSLAAWIGIYALFLIVKPVSRRAITALHSPIKVTLAGWITPGALGAIQMVALFGVLAGALHFEIQNPIGTYGMMVLASLTFTAIILALNIWLGSVGQFLGLVLMVLQLVTAGGTFPWQTLPEPLAWLHHFLPMGFAVDGIRQLMYGGDAAAAGHDAILLALVLVGALVVAAIGVTRMTHFRTLRDLQPSLIG
jgi:putative membrane protein